MCGIVGYIGNKKTESILMSGLSRLEYRGYDSAGIAIAEEGVISILKESGKLIGLKKLIQEKPLKGLIGIGHTRWATHGEPSQRNAHPHLDCTGSIAVVHNGIIENHEILREQLIREGHAFQSDTDSEVLSHLIERYHIQQKQSLEDAVRSVLSVIEGSYAFCILSSNDSTQIVAARNGSPLVLGLGEAESFVASDASAFLDHTRNAIFLEDYQMAVVTREGIRITSRKGEVVENKVTAIDWDAKDATKEGFDHFMLKEIEEQPDMIERILRKRLANGSTLSLFDQLRIDEKELHGIQRVQIQACGTSWHAALIGKFLLEGLAGISTDVDVSSEFRYRDVIRQPNSLVLSITQSGETIDTLMGLRRARELGFKTLSICNVLGSTIARESDAVIFTHAGPEIGVASTKAYTAQISMLLLLSLYWGKQRGHLKEERLDKIVEDLKQIPAKMKNIINRKSEMKTIAEKYADARDFLFLGRGINYPSAHEGALKLKEIAYIHATGHPAGEMKHGPIALIDAKLPVVAIAPMSSTYEKMASNIQEVKARSGKVISIVTEGNDSVAHFSNDVFTIDATHEFLSPLLVALPLQYLAYYVAVLRGTDVDQPRNLAKSVTVE
jgi:glutamine---fructose-6-phosphate transaminase (isomerizing)